MQDIDRLSRQVPVLCKVAPNGHYHVQDVNRAGGIMAILGVLARAGLVDTSVNRADGGLWPMCCRNMTWLPPDLRRGGKNST